MLLQANFVIDFINFDPIFFFGETFAANLKTRGVDGDL